MSAKEENEMKERLKKLECPFTWAMEDILKDEKSEIQYHDNDDEEFLPFLQVIRKIMTAYVFTHIDAKENKDKILDVLDKCKQHLQELKNESDSEISFEVVEYVWKATKCFVYEKLGLKDELEEILDEIKEVDLTDNKKKSTLTACRAAGWSKYHRSGAYEAEKYIREAIKDNPDCALWYFILAKNLRRQRRDASISAKPSKQEEENFLKALKLSNNMVFQIFVAQLYREMNNDSKALEIYKQIFDRNPNEMTILLRLALGFIRLKQFGKAKECLDKASRKNLDSSMLHHYYGIYYMKQRMFNEAIPFYQKAIRENNLPAEKDYLQCLQRTRRMGDKIQTLLKMIQKYNYMPKTQTQTFILDVAICYWKIKQDFKNAVNYFLQAIEINPNARCFTDYFDWLKLVNYQRNVYTLLKQQFIPFAVNKKSQYDQETVAKIDKLKKICDDHYSNQMSSVEGIFGKLTV